MGRRSPSAYPPGYICAAPHGTHTRFTCRRSPGLHNTLRQPPGIEIQLEP